ncbi:hypothetical protein ADL30_00225 [Streptomyces sp. NRRL S-1521]|nr:hypothetical protein ADL30_00225 [Streptomyces sp. NRRL S-1521]
MLSRVTAMTASASTPARGRGTSQSVAGSPARRSISHPSASRPVTATAMPRTTGTAVCHSADQAGVERRVP